MPTFQTPYGTVDAPDLGAAQKWLVKQNPAAAPQHDTGNAIGAFWQGLQKGAGDIPYGIAQGAQHLAAPLAGPVQRVVNALGMGGAGAEKPPNMDQLVAQREANYQKSPDVTHHLWASMLGNVAGTALATAPLGFAGGALAKGASVARGIGTAAGLGGAGAAIEPTTVGPKEDFWTQKEKQVALGAATGGALGGAGRLAGAAIAPRLGGDAAALASKGVQLTPGQMVSGSLGAPARFAEAKLQSFPILGDFIAHARGQSLKSYNTATINQALEPIGASLPKNISAGNQAIKFAGNAVSKAYDNVLGRIPQVVRDPELTNALKAVELDARQRPAVWRTLRGEIQRTVGKLQREGPITGREAQRASSELERLARGFQNSEDFSQREIARYLREVRSAISDAIERQYPQDAPALRNAHAAQAMLVRIENAANRRAGSEGIFTPMDLLSSIRSSASGVRRREFARGDALMQEWAQQGQRLLPSMVPDSGTAGRLLLLERAALAVPGLPAGLAYRVLGSAARSSPTDLRRGIGVAARRGAVGAAPTAGAETVRKRAPLEFRIESTNP